MSWKPAFGLMLRPIKLYDSDTSTEEKSPYGQEKNTSRHFTVKQVSQDVAGLSQHCYKQQHRLTAAEQQIQNIAKLSLITMSKR